jgi:hypothetical protein
MAESGLLSEDRDERILSVRDIVLQVLTPTEVTVLSVASELKRANGRPPTASEIRLVLTKRSDLKKTQLYDLLRRLGQLGFIAVRTLPRPRRYIVNQSTLIVGITNWIEGQKRSIHGMSEELDALSHALQKPKTRKHEWLSPDGLVRE